MQHGFISSLGLDAIVVAIVALPACSSGPGGSASHTEAIDAFAGPPGVTNAMGPGGAHGGDGEVGTFPGNGTGDAGIGGNRADAGWTGRDSSGHRAPRGTGGTTDAYASTSADAASASDDARPDLLEFSDVDGAGSKDAALPRESDAKHVEDVATDVAFEVGLTDARGGLSDVHRDANGRALVEDARAYDEAPGPPATLASLTVKPLALSPQFSPGIHDYFVSCNSGTNSLTVAAAASSGASVRLLKPTPSAAAAAQNLSLDLLEDQAVVLEVSGSGPSDQYWVRCLPHDFPRIKVTSHPTPQGPTPGWYLFANMDWSNNEASFAMAVDVRGTPVWYHRVATTSGTLNVEVLEHNAISFTPRLGELFGTLANGRYEIHDLATSQVRYAQAVGSPTDHHEFRLLPNGHALVTSYVITPGMDMKGNGGFSTGTTIADCAIQEIDSSGTKVWSWLASEHFDLGQEPVDPEEDSINGGIVIDPFHCNSIDVDGNGNLLVSARHMDAVFLVNKQTGKVVWKMGGVAFNEDGAQLIRIEGDPQTAFHHQHDARLRPNGNVSLFDDQTNGEGPARGVEYAIDFTTGVATVAWQYRQTAGSDAMGSCRRYADGNTVIGWGSIGSAPGLVLSEIDSLGNDVLDMSFASGASSYRAVKVTDAEVDLGLLRENAGLP